jgi:hypothetical protein
MLNTFHSPEAISNQLTSSHCKNQSCSTSEKETMCSLTLMLRCIVISSVASLSYLDAFTWSDHYRSDPREITCTRIRNLPLITKPPVYSKSRITMLAAPDSKQLARQLYEENVMPIEEEDDFTHNINNRSNGYDRDNMSPLESEFKSLMTTFLTYTEQDIRSLTSTSCRYLDYATSDDGTVYNKGHNVRSKEIGIRYRALFEGVQRLVFPLSILHVFLNCNIDLDLTHNFGVYHDTTHYKLPII